VAANLYNIVQTQSGGMTVRAVDDELDAAVGDDDCPTVGSSHLRVVCGNTGTEQLNVTIGSTANGDLVGMQVRVLFFRDSVSSDADQS
jgi:hypothetical protein